METMMNTPVFQTKTGVALTLIPSNTTHSNTTLVNNEYIKTTDINLVKENGQVMRDLTIPQFLMLRNQGDKVDPSRVRFFEIEDIQLGLINKNIELSIHAQEQMKQRGYSNKDVVSAIWTGQRTQLQFHRGAFKAVIEGLDAFGNPINLVMGCEKFTKQTKKNQFYIEKSEVFQCFSEYISSNKLVVISVMPPTANKFTRHVTHYSDLNIV